MIATFAIFSLSLLLTSTSTESFTGSNFNYAFHFRKSSSSVLHDKILNNLYKFSIRPIYLSYNSANSANDDENYNKHLYREFNVISKGSDSLDFSSFLKWEEIQVSDNNYDWTSSYYVLFNSGNFSR